MGLFTPLYMRSFISRSGANYKLRHKACEQVKKIVDPDKLRQIALEAPDLSVRMTAVGLLRDGGLLADLALGDAASEVRATAFKRLEALGDQPALARVAIRCEDWRMRRSAAERVTDETLARRIAGESPHADAQGKAVENIRNQAVLAALARDADFAARYTAIARLEDQGLLAELALGDANATARGAAARMLTDPAALARVAVEDPDRFVRKDAVQNPHMTDVEALAKVALADADEYLRGKAVESPHMTDTAVLAKAALEDPDHLVRWKALQNPHMTDAAALAKIALEAPDDDLRRLAVKNPNLVDQAIFEKLSGEDSAVGQAAVARMTDVRALERIARESEDSQKPVIAVGWIGDVETLARIALDGDVKRAEARWNAALKLMELDPARAVGPAVALMKDPRAQDDDLGPHLTDLCKRAAEFLMQQYRDAADPAVREIIASVPNGRYGWYDDDCNPRDRLERIHFDLAR